MKTVYNKDSIKTFPIKNIPHTLVDAYCKGLQVLQVNVMDSTRFYNVVEIFAHYLVYEIHCDPISVCNGDLREPAAFVFVVEDRMVGACQMFKCKWRKCMVIGWIYIHPSYRNKGYFSALYRYFTEKYTKIDIQCPSDQMISILKNLEHEYVRS